MLLTVKEYSATASYYSSTMVTFSDAGYLLVLLMVLLLSSCLPRKIV